jgi:hypothetical protein
MINYTTNITETNHEKALKTVRHIKINNKQYIKTTGKGKIRPRRDHENPVAEYSCSSTLSLTTALDWDDWLMPRPGRFTSRERDPVHIL